MLFYAHLCLARIILQTYELEKTIVSGPERKADYYLGSILPDIRYFSGTAREETHPSLSNFVALARSSENKAFASGFLVHLLVDEIELDLSGLSVSTRVQNRFWFLPSRLRTKITSLLSNALIELYYLDRYFPDFQISVDGNDLTSRLGIEESNIRIIKLHIDGFLRAPTLQNVSHLLEQMGLVKNEKIRRYLDVAFFLDRQPILKRFMIWRVAKVIDLLEQSLISEIRTHFESTAS